MNIVVRHRNVYKYCYGRSTELLSDTITIFSEVEI